MEENYLNSKKELKQKLEENPEFTREEWDIYAKENNLFNAIALSSKLIVNSWDELKNKL